MSRSRLRDASGPRNSATTRRSAGSRAVDRYGEKLATPDITIADLIGEVDPIKVAEGRYLSDELTIHFGLIPRTNRGIFCINELPDLAERIQVGLLNIMEERDVQIRGFRVRLPLDVLIVASANPEDYTNRGRIITPLKDRYGAQIRTHYPSELETELEIVNAGIGSRDGCAGTQHLNTPDYMAEIVAEIVRLARRSPDVSQRSGVSVRASIAGYETLTANAMRRAILAGEDQVAPRICDLWHLAPALAGQDGTGNGRRGRRREGDREADRRRDRGRLRTLLRARRARAGDCTQFKSGLAVEVGEALKAGDYAAIVGRVEGLDEALQPLNVGEDAASLAAAVEFLFEGSAPEQAPQQGRRRRQRLLPRLDCAGDLPTLWGECPFLVISPPPLWGEMPKAEGESPTAGIPRQSEGSAHAHPIPILAVGWYARTFPPSTPTTSCNRSPTTCSPSAICSKRCAT